MTKNSPAAASDVIPNWQSFLALIVIITNLYILMILGFALSNSVYSYIVVSARANLLPREGATRKYISIAYALNQFSIVFGAPSASVRLAIG